jgi:hypothetical protein
MKQTEALEVLGILESSKLQQIKYSSIFEGLKNGNFKHNLNPILSSIFTKKIDIYIYEFAFKVIF